MTGHVCAEDFPEGVLVFSVADYVQVSIVVGSGVTTKEF